MDPNLLDKYHQFQLLNESCPNITAAYLDSLWKLVYQSHQQNQYSEPMPWIGMYIAIASLFCILAMGADLLPGLRNRKLWFPCRYFTLNAASLTVIAVAIKLPMDLNSLMGGYVDQAAKIGSVSFMCTMMANILPSLANMNSKELVSNMIAFGILVITLVGNVCIQIYTGILFYSVDDTILLGSGRLFTDRFVYVAILVVPLLMLLIIYTCSSLAILKSKQMLESKYQDTEKDQEQPGRLLTVEQLKKHLSNYWIMTGTGSPQFMTTCSATTSASGVICVLSNGLIIYIMIVNFRDLGDYKSDYKWSMSVIFIIQFIGVLLGTIAPLARWFAALSFKLSVNWMWKQVNVFKVESYWTQKLYDWKQSSIPFPGRSRNFRIVTQRLKILSLIICIGFQNTTVVACKMIAVIPVLILICVLYCLYCWKWLKAMLSPSHIVSGKNPNEQVGKDKDLSGYVLQLQDDIQFTKTTLKRMLNSVNGFIHKARKQQLKCLMELLEKSTGIEGVERFDSHHVPTLLSEDYPNCWSLPLVTLTVIAMSLPNIQKNMVDFLLRGVSEGLLYVTLVEQSLNAN